MTKRIFTIQAFVFLFLSLFAGIAFSAERSNTAELVVVNRPEKFAPSVVTTTNNNEEEPEPVEKVSCAENPGRSFCRQARQFASLLQYCQRQGCLALFDRQIRIADDLVDHYNAEIIDMFEEAEERLGQMAFDVADRLCNYHVRGDRQWIIRLANSYNLVLNSLRDAQNKAARGFVRYCQFVIH